MTTTTFDDSTTATKQNGSTTTAASTSGHPTSTTAPPTSSIPQTSTTTSTTLASSTSSSTPVDDVLAGHQQRLTDLGYWLGTVDSQAGSLTAHAVTAFQKAEGLPRTGQLDDATVERLANATTPRARSSTGVVLEIDLARQILLVADDGIVTRIYDIATGAAATPTPPGQFEIDREIDGIRDAPLGRLYRPKYFNGGIALHGYTSVPPQPASHGCVRLTYAAMDDLWASGRAPVGTPVWVS
ncbi:MAG: L,D-transpeptidase family protein [Actinomycetota bacterium]